MKRRLIGAAVAAVLLIAGAAPAVVANDDVVWTSVICWKSHTQSFERPAYGDDHAAALAFAESLCESQGGSLTRPARQEGDTSVECWFNHYNTSRNFNTEAACTDAGGSLTRPAPPSSVPASVTCWTDPDTSTTVNGTGAALHDALAAARQACRDSGGSTTRPVAAWVACWPRDGGNGNSITIIRTGSTEAAATAAATAACTASGGSLTMPPPPASVTCWTDHNTGSTITRTGTTSSAATVAATKACTDSGGSTTRPPAPPPPSPSSVGIRCWTDYNTTTSIIRKASTTKAAMAAARKACTDSGGSLTRPAAPVPTPTPTPPPAPTPPAERNEDLQELVEGILCWFTLPDLRSESRPSVLDCIGAGGSTTKPLPPSPQHQIPEVPLTSSPEPDWPSVTVTCWLSRDSRTSVTQSGSTEANARGAAIRACRDDHDGTITRPPAEPPPAQQSASVTCWSRRDPVCEGVIGSCQPASSTVTRTAATFDDASAAARKACVDSGGSLNRPPYYETCWVYPDDGSEPVDLGQVASTSSGSQTCARRQAAWREENENAPIMPPADAEKPPDKTQDENYREAFRRSRGGSSGGGVRGGSRGGGVRGGGGGGGGGMPPYFDDDILP